MWGFLQWNLRVEKVLNLWGFLWALNIQQDIGLAVFQCLAQLHWGRVTHDRPYRPTPPGPHAPQLGEGTLYLKKLLTRTCPLPNLQPKVRMCQD